MNISLTSFRKAGLATMAIAALVAGTAACGGKLQTNAESATDDAVVAVADDAAEGSAADVASASDLGRAEVPAGANVVVAGASDAGSDVAVTETESTSTETDAVVESSGTTEVETAPAESSETESSSSSSSSSGSSSSSSSSSGSGGFTPPTLPGFDGLSGVSSATPGPASLWLMIFAGTNGDVTATAIINEGGAGRNDVVSVQLSYTSGRRTVTKNLVMVDDEGTQTAWSLDHMNLSEGDRVRFEIVDKAGNVTVETGRVSLMPVL